MMLIIFLFLIVIGVANRPLVGGLWEIIDLFLIIAITITGIVLQIKTNDKKRGE